MARPSRRREALDELGCLAQTAMALTGAHSMAHRVCAGLRLELARSEPRARQAPVAPRSVWPRPALGSLSCSGPGRALGAQGARRASGPRVRGRPARLEAVQRSPVGPEPKEERLHCSCAARDHASRWWTIGRSTAGAQSGHHPRRLRGGARHLRWTCPLLRRIRALSWGSERICLDVTNLSDLLALRQGNRAG